MKTNKQYLDESTELDTLIKSVIENAKSDMPETFGCKEVEALECRSRDGFIPYSHNCGGYRFQDFSDVRMIWGSGNYPASKEATKQINKMVKQNEEYAREELKDALKDIPKRKQNYHDLIELGHSDLAEDLDNKASEMGAEDTIMYEIQIMYNGVNEDGKHVCYVSAAVNWECPYHRSSISWMPGFKCEDCKGKEVTFKTLKQAEARLTKALKECMDKIF